MGAQDERSPEDRHRNKRPRHDSRSPDRGYAHRHHKDSRRERERSRERTSERSSRHASDRWYEDRRGFEQGRQERERHRDREGHHSSREDRQHDSHHERRSRPSQHYSTREDSRQDHHNGRADNDDHRSSRPQQEDLLQGDDHRGRSRGDWNDKDEGRGQRGDRPQQRPSPPRQQQQHRQGPRREDHGGGGKQRWGKPEEWSDHEEAAPPVAKEAPNMGLSGKLAAETNKTVDGTSELKYQPPPEARVCKKPRWLLYCFKGDKEAAPTITMNQLPFYLFGKDRKVADIPTDHPTCSRQHAVLCFREVEVDAPDGLAMRRVVKPYLMDLESVNGTTVNKERLEGARYYELLHMDVIRFGLSSREYVIMNESQVS